MTDTITNPPVSAGPQRPTMLTVLCILTFIGCAYGLYKNIRDYINADTYGAIITRTIDQVSSDVKESVKDKPEGKEFVDKVLSGASAIADPVKLKKYAMFGILSNLLAFGGAFLMFHLRKIGFWVYVLHAAVAIMSPLVVYGMNNMVMGISSIGTAFVAILFCALYSLNLKHMS